MKIITTSKNAALLIYNPLFHTGCFWLLLLLSFLLTHLLF